MTTVEPRPVGALLRQWRERRRLSQLQLSLDADISSRHLSFVETGRSKPTREMILRLSEQLDVPLRERNGLLLAGGYAPVYPASSLDAPELDAVRTALRQVLAGHEPNPALVVDRHWNLVDGNAGVQLFLDGAAPDLLAPPVNVLRLSLHPEGAAPNIVNLGEWRAHVLGRLRRQAAATGDPVLHDLHAELRDYPCDQPESEVDVPGAGDVVVPLRFRRGDEVLSFFSTTTVFGTPLDITVAELAIESFFPADQSTKDYLQATGRARPGA
ncbi:helix-turn-helix transcriptional regulator [Saccharopolyspora sp. WRP15-2]|uniref:Helix-turn-helix transcriptional regulator n=1 Tax=Saccharopolyspora oryzae TaxID=2997343 RepID=A0ABT4V1P5_9PSEU|nr:helix-turn-helix transcriptional regulator [Saccharopolyspora oryzae]MDA3627875.1 helix-turn-helix transcriptional regulator [Saccharopolyspora oryzae]